MAITARKPPPVWTASSQGLGSEPLWSPAQRLLLQDQKEDGGAGEGSSPLPSTLCPSPGPTLQKSLRNKFSPWEMQVC